MLHEISFQSFNQRDQVQGWIYVPQPGLWASFSWSTASGSTPGAIFT